MYAKVQPEAVQEAAELSAVSPAEQGGRQRRGVWRDLRHSSQSVPDFQGLSLEFLLFFRSSFTFHGFKSMTSERSSFFLMKSVH